MKDLKTITILFRATDALERVIREDTKQYGLNLTEFGVMEALYHKGELPVATILDKVLVANSSMSYALDILEKKQFITRVKNPHDGRSFLITLTEQGKTLFDCVYQEHFKNMRHYLGSLSAKEERMLQELLKKMGKKLEERQ